MRFLLMLLALITAPAALMAQTSGADDMNVAGWATYIWVGAFFIVCILVIAVAGLGIRSKNQ